MKALIVDDHASSRDRLRECLTRAGAVEIVEAGSLAEARKKLSDDPDLDVVLIDLCLDDENDPLNRDGFVVVDEVRKRSTAEPIIVTNTFNIAEVRQAMSLGARSYILKIELDGGEIPALAGLRERCSLEDAAMGLIGSSQAMVSLRRTIRKMARTDLPVLILGPTGSGKELVAKAIHRLSKRHEKGKLLAVNCATFEGGTARAQLFGHTKGAFSGADKASPGYLAWTGQGTLFLDEIGRLPLPFQPMLLRVLQTGDYIAVGASKESRFEGRLLAAANMNLASRETRRREGFLDDLYERLAVLLIRVPGLDARREDIPELAAHFANTADREPPFRLSADALEALAQRSWPHNVRELEHYVAGLAALVERDVATREDVEDYASTRDSPGSARGAGSQRLLAGIDLYGPRDLNELKLTLNQIQLLTEEGKTVQQICDVMKISRPTYYNIKARGASMRASDDRP